MALVEVQSLTKRFQRPLKKSGFIGSVEYLFKPKYEEKIAINKVSFSIDPGEAVAYVGPNGAGKSTTIKILTGIITPTSGTVKVEGRIPYNERVQNARRIGVVFGQRTQLWWDLPVQDSFRLLGDIYQIPKQDFQKSFTECIELLDLVPLLHTPARQLSLGQRVRCDIAASLLHSPPLLFLDEPTIGLDIAVKDRIREFIKQIQQERHVTILLTSHDLGDIINLCQRLIMINQGKIVFDGPIYSILDHFGCERIIHLLLNQPFPNAIKQILTVIPELPGNAVQQLESHHLSIHFNSEKLTAGVIAGRLLPILPVKDLQIEEPNIETIIRQLYTGKLHFD